MNDVRPRRRPAAFAVVSWALGLVLLVFVAAPLVALLTGTSLHEFLTTVGQADVRQALFVSVEAALLATALAAVGGVPLAYLLARRSFRGKRLVEGLIDLPIVFPHTAAGIALLLVFGRSGVFGRGFAHLGIAFTDTLAGIVVAMLFVSLPFLVDTAREAFALVDPGYERVARTLGATPGTQRVQVDSAGGTDFFYASAIANPVLRNYAIVSSKLPLDEPDRCPEELLNRILWAAQKGPNTPYPVWAVSKVPPRGEPPPQSAGRP